MASASTPAGVTTAMSSRTAGKLVTSANCSAPGAAAARASKSSSNAAPPSRSQARVTSGCSSPIQPSSTTPAWITAARPGCRKGCASLGAANASSTRAAAPMASTSPLAA